MEKQSVSDFDSFPFIEMTPDLVCVAGKDGYLRKVNKAVLEKLGYTEQELLSRHISTFIHPEDIENTFREREKLINGKVLLNFENRYLTKTGEVVWLEWTSIYFGDKEIVFAIAKEVTERKKMEQEVTVKFQQYKSLARHFKDSIEKDRKYLSVELHEELAQLASVIKMDIDWVRLHETEISEKSKSRIEHASVISNLLINTMRRISFAISPNMLDDLGLQATLEWLCKEFSILNGIPCEFQADYIEEHFSKEVKIDFFRICQESLSNILYHAEAKKAEVRLFEKNRKLILQIKDDGIGFEEEQLAVQSGLKSMRERANSINGELTIDSGIDKGTCITLSFEQ